MGGNCGIWIWVWNETMNVEWQEVLSMRSDQGGRDGFADMAIILFLP